MNKEIEIPEGNMVIIEKKESEDERIRKDIVALIKFALKDGSAVSPGSYTTKEEALAYLERLKDQQPAEWSKEDEDIINEIASILINDENRADNKVEEDRLAYLSEKIQSLCPQFHWKPSEEQMEVDIEKEIEEHAINMPHGEFTHESECIEHEEWAKREFHHFYELGRARKEE